MEILRIFTIYLALLAAQGGVYAGAVDPNATLPPVTPTPYVTVTPVPTATPRPYTALSQGMRDDNVKRMQEALVRLGYLSSGSADGAYGPKTREAVEEFQRTNGLTVDGKAGNETLQLLYDGSPRRKGQTPVTPTPSPTPAPTAEPQDAYLTVTYIDQFDHVLLEEQLTLRATTIVRADLSRLPDGYTIESESEVQVLYDPRGKVYPATVIFELESPFIPESRQIPLVYLCTEDGEETVLYEVVCDVPVGSSVKIDADLTLVPGYRLVSAPSVFAVSDLKGNTVPDRMEFIFEKDGEEQGL